MKISIFYGISDTAHLRRISLTVQFMLQGVNLGQILAPRPNYNPWLADIYKNHFTDLNLEEGKTNLKTNTY